jgi:lipopolysaccharide/colanic/teichoic acid biosynthesis glycosyltransferase
MDMGAKVGQAHGTGHASRISRVESYQRGEAVGALTSQDMVMDHLMAIRAALPRGTRDVPRQSAVHELSIRLLDLAGAAGILILSLPIMTLLAVLIKVSSPGPILYKQERVGKSGRVFTLYKFRSMIDDAEKHVGPVWAAKDDGRVTPLGKVMRKMRFDELPQLFNVIKGDMSLVGPRPERPFFVGRHKALQGIRLAVKPGLTGLAQIRAFYDLKPDHKLRYDHLYIQNRSFWLNISILAKTIPVVLQKTGW